MVKLHQAPAWNTTYEGFGNTLGSRIREIRIERRMTCRDLAKATGLCEHSIGNIENDKVLPEVPTLRLLSDVLKVPVAFIGRFDLLPEESLSNRITKARLFMCLTKAEFALVVGVSDKTVLNWEQGKRQPSHKLMLKLQPFLVSK